MMRFLAMLSLTTILTGCYSGLYIEKPDGLLWKDKAFIYELNKDIDNSDKISLIKEVSGYTNSKDFFNTYLIDEEKFNPNYSKNLTELYVFDINHDGAKDFIFNSRVVGKENKELVVFIYEKPSRKYKEILFDHGDLIALNSDDEKKRLSLLIFKYACRCASPDEQKDQFVKVTIPIN